VDFPFELYNREMSNPLYEKWKAFQAQAPGRYVILGESALREKMCQAYSWAIPDEEAIRTLAQFSPLVEIGAGRGYWTALLQKMGADIVAYDLNPPHTHQNAWHPKDGTPSYTSVFVGGPEVVRDHQDRNLFLCWPPYDDPMAYNCLYWYRGKHVIYIGEGHGGCTGDDKFHNTLERDFELIMRVEIPVWRGIHDSLEVWERKYG
jgi:hypothetical protein